MADIKKDDSKKRPHNKDNNDEPISKKAKKTKGVLINTLTKAQVQEIIDYMKNNRISSGKPCYITKSTRGWICNLKPTKKKGGEPKYPQFNIERFGFPKDTKILVHHLFWRYNNDGALVDESPDMHISHLDEDRNYIECVQESVNMNESRKYCHLFGWYKAKEGEDRPRCPHWETPCTGPS